MIIFRHPRMKDNLKYFFAAFSVIVAVLAIWYFRSIVAYILIAAVFSLIGRPIVDFLNKIKLWKFHLNRSICAGLTLLLFWAVFFGFFRTFVPLILSQAQDLSEIDFTRSGELDPVIINLPVFSLLLSMATRNAGNSSGNIWASSIPVFSGFKRKNRSGSWEMI